MECPFVADSVTKQTGEKKAVFPTFLGLQMDCQKISIFNFTISARNIA